MAEISVEDIIASIKAVQEKLQRPLERKLFAYLVENAGKWRTCEEIQCAVGYRSAACVPGAVCKLRKKVEVLTTWRILSKDNFGYMIDNCPEQRSAEKVLERGILSLNLDSQRMYFNGEEIFATHTVFGFLQLLLEAPPGELLLVEELTKKLFPDANKPRRSLEWLVRQTRHALGDDPRSPKYLVFVGRAGKRRGYLLKV